MCACVYIYTHTGNYTDYEIQSCPYWKISIVQLQRQVICRIMIIVLFSHCSGLQVFVVKFNLMWIQGFGSPKST